MKIKSSFFLLGLVGVAMALLFGTSCERHPASQTIPHYEQKKAAREAAAESEKIAPAPKNSQRLFFPKEQH